ncbi:MAG: nuclear transport factor 2 family protein [Sandaracinaceae bacterium]
MTHPNEALLTQFYEAFAARDGETMASCYAEDASFSDPVFPDLDGREAGGMWRMLTSRAADLRIEHSQIQANDETGSAHWEAWYTFSATGRKVHNVIDARFRFRDGKIIEHIDTFDFGRWSRQAIGMPAILLGWTGAIQKKVRATAGGQLKKYLASH